MLPGRQLERETTRMRLLAHRDRRRTARIGNDDERAGLDALITAVRRVRDGRAARIVIGENRREPIRRSRPHAVEQREIAVAVPEEPQHRHHAIDRVQ